MLITEPVNLSFKAIWFLLLDHFYVSLSYFLNLHQAAVTESVASQSYLNKGGVLVQGFKQDCFYVFREEVIVQFYATDVLVVLKSVNQVNQAGIVQTTGAEVELLKAGTGVGIGYDVGKVSHNVVTQKILVANQYVDVC